MCVEGSVGVDGCNDPLKAMKIVEKGILIFWDIIICVFRIWIFKGEGFGIAKTVNVGGI